MQTPRFLPAIAVIALCASTFSTRASDTPAQAAARAMLMQDSNDTGSVENATPPQTPPPPAPVTPPPAPEPVTPPPAPAMNMETNMPVATPAPVMTSGSSTNLVLPPVEQENVPTNQVTQYPVNPAPSNPSTVQTNLPPLPPPTTPGTAPEQPVAAPPLPISDGQRQQLDALLQQYVSNQITPAQYQAARAKILAGQ